MNSTQSQGVVHILYNALEGEGWSAICYMRYIREGGFFCWCYITLCIRIRFLGRPFIKTLHSWRDWWSLTHYCFACFCLQLYSCYFIIFTAYTNIAAFLSNVYLRGEGGGLGQCYIILGGLTYCYIMLYGRGAEGGCQKINIFVLYMYNMWTTPKHTYLILVYLDSFYCKLGS